MHLSSRTSEGLGQTTGLIGIGEGCAILVGIEGKTICPRREPLKGWILSPLRRRVRRTTGLNQTYGNVPGTQYFLVPRMRKDGVGILGRKPQPNTENHTGD